MGIVTLNSPTPGMAYVLFYVLAFLAGMLFLLHEGQRRGYPMDRWMLTIFSAFVFFVIGCKAVLFTYDNWLDVIRGEEYVPVKGRTMIGGLIFGLAGILFAIRWFRLPWSLLDSFAFLIPVTLLLQRVGCFLAGCCHGTPTSLPWGVTYGEHYHAFHKHVSSGLIDVTAQHSLPIHPVQLYEVAGCIVIIAVLLYARKHRRFKGQGSLLLFSTFLYCVLRFCDEFFRATSLPTVFGMNKVQLVVAAMAAFSFFVLIGLEKKPNYQVQSLSYPITFTSPFIFFLLVGTLYSVSWAVLDTLEVIALYPIVLLATATMLYSAFQTLTVPARRLAICTLLVLSVALMSQMAPQKEEKNLEQHHYYTVAVSMLSGQHTFTDEIVSCDGSETLTVAKFREKYTSGGINISRTDVVGNRMFTYGLGSHIGKFTEKGYDNVNTSRDLLFYSITPYARYDWKHFGLGAGLGFGDMPVINRRFEYEQATLIRRYSVYPRFSVRVGSLRKIFGEFRFGEGFADAFPGSQFQILTGYGFHSESGAAMRLGTSSNAGIILSGSVPAGDRVLIESFLGVGKSLFNHYASESNFQGSLRIAYRIGYQ